MESDSIERKWHKAFANDIPTHLKHLTGEISADFDRTKDQIVACAPPSIRAKIRAASDQLDARTALTSARGRYLDVIDKLQRSYKGTFSNVLQTQLKPHYSRVAAQKGRGMLRRMKEENEQYFSAESSELFLGVVDSIVQSFRDAHDDGQKEFEEELERLYRHFQGSLVCVQGSADGNQVATKDAKAMVALISDFNQKSNIFVEAIDSRLHHLANNGDAMAVDP
ncbi:hypothetical protein BV22DRAFT_1121970 [Leucogyrophana mollusca]|uniref:Uncharacterized protein n=1 Tax=Leucogyrophana mollusca TaxID=85980 RepID=A0ACB8B8Y6_9AGAM|nr:hypothetical protein BV22DRAFT_1121970 [Leucogyrophana mollusca]